MNRLEVACEPKRVVSVAADPGPPPGYVARLACGHELWLAIEPHFEEIVCSACLDLALAPARQASGRTYLKAHLKALSSPALARIYDEEYSIDAVAAILRRNAASGYLRGVDVEADLAYRKKCAARHAPSRTSVIFTRDDVAGSPKGWHASLCFISETGYLPWNEPAAEIWLRALYGGDREKAVSRGAVSDIGAVKGVRHFLLPVERW